MLSISGAAFSGGTTSLGSWNQAAGSTIGADVPIFGTSATAATIDGLLSSVLGSTLGCGFACCCACACGFGSGFSGAGLVAIGPEAGVFIDGSAGSFCGCGDGFVEIGPDGGVFIGAGVVGRCGAIRARGCVDVVGTGAAGREVAGGAVTFVCASASTPSCLLSGGAAFAAAAPGVALALRMTRPFDQSSSAWHASQRTTACGGPLSTLSGSARLHVGHAAVTCPPAPSIPWQPARASAPLRGHSIAADPPSPRR